MENLKNQVNLIRVDISRANKNEGLNFAEDLIEFLFEQI